MAPNIWSAALEGDTEQLSHFRHSSLDEKDSEGATALYIAAAHGRTRAVAYLLDARCSVNVRCTTHLATPLLVAAQEGHSEVVSALLTAKSDVDFQTVRGETALFAALRRRQSVKIIRTLLRAGSSPNVSLKENNKTMLMEACMFHHYAYVDSVGALLRWRADVNLRDNYGLSALDQVASISTLGRRDREDIVLLLLEARANADEPSRDGLSPLQVAVMVGNEDVAKALVRFGVRQSPWCGPNGGLLSPSDIAEEAGHSALCAWLRRVQGFTQLHFACETGSVETVRTLLRCDQVDVFARAESGKTALSVAMESVTTRSTIVPYLLRLAMGPWNCTAHCVWPTSFRTGTFSVLLVAHRLNYEQHIGEDPKGTMAPPPLPQPVWFKILSFCDRVWFSL